MTTGERIKEARKYRKMTQKQLAEAAGVATGTIQSIKYFYSRLSPSRFHPYQISNARSR